MIPLSFAQKRLWFFNQLEGPGSTYNVPVTVRIDGLLDKAALGAALQDLLQRHESLRTVFVTQGAEPSQRVLPLADTGFALQVRDCTPDAVERTIAQVVSEPFDLEADVLVRAFLLGVDDEHHVLVLVVHHAVCDGWSMTPLLRDLGAAYNARSAGTAPDWAPLPVQYTDYTLWQRDLLGGEDDPDSLVNRQLVYWREALAELPDELTLPFDRPRPAVASYRGAEVGFEITPALHTALVEIGRRTRTSLYNVLQAAVAALLSRLGAGDDIPFGTPIAGRTDRALDDLVGFFINTLVLRTDVSGDPTFHELVRRTWDSSIAAHTHQDLPFERLVEAINPPRSRSRHPLFQVGLELHNGDLTLGLDGLVTDVALLKTGVAKFDLSVTMRQRTSPDGTALGITGAIEYATDLFDRATVAALAERLVRFLGRLVAQPDRGVATFDILTDAEHQQLRRWNETSVELAEQTVADSFEARAALTPDTIALVSGDTRHSYADLNAWANRLAHHLISVGVGPDTLVAVALPRTAEAVVAWLAAIKAGGVYTPIDSYNPIERTRSVLDAARPAVLVTTEVIATALGPVPTAPVLVTDHLQQDRPDHDPTDADRVTSLRLDHAAYVIFTSGSTGRPKGVTVLHRALTNLLAYHRGITYPSPTGSGDRLRVALTASLAFDTSWEGVLAMICGHELHLLDEHDRRDPARLVDYVVTHGIGQLDVTPSYAQQLLTEGVLAAEQAPRTLMLGGEEVGEALWQELRAAPNTTVYNYYGPSEFCVEATGCALAESSSPNIGRPVHNARVHVLDENLMPVPPGVLGEMYLAGANIGRGYVGQPGLTAERFVANPYGIPGERMYRSGDLARWTSEGALAFAGRSDEQVKVRGFRIEPGEIQSVLRTDSDVAETVVVVREDTPGDKRIVAYIVPAPGATPDTSALREATAAVLPDYMVPAAIVVLDALPLTRNGKLDRRALPAPDYGSRARGRTPVSERERQIADLFTEFLKVDDVFLDDNFFELGGHSLLATRLVNRIRTSLGLEVNLMKLFETPTVAGVVASLGYESASTSHRPPLLRRA
ncbi:amino acid adenylation domain-containing protein [Streptomyces sp. NPDC059076]|uniref:non-ribosomal peptide synthetase n=1 Tax=unclassified Streptomyces TaxID=2593676 RepID=UPI0036AA8B2A